MTADALARARAYLDALSAAMALGLSWRLHTLAEESQVLVRDLCEAVEARDAEIARLRDALGALVDAEAHGTPGGYIGVDPSGETHDRHCTYCYTSWQLGEPERHAPDCPVATARALLEGGA